MARILKSARIRLRAVFCSPVTNLPCKDSSGDNRFIVGSRVEGGVDAAATTALKPVALNADLEAQWLQLVVWVIELPSCITR